MSKAIGLVLVDIDGTLYGSDGIPDSAWAAVDHARAQGIHFSICTGRPGRGPTLEYAQRLDPRGFHIFESGAVILDGQGQLCKTQPLGQDNIEELQELGRQYAIPLEIYSVDGGFWVEQSNQHILDHEVLLGLPASALPAKLDYDRIARVQYVAPAGAPWEAIKAEVLAYSDLELHVATSPGMPGAIFGSVTRHGISKKTAGAWVGAQFGLRQPNIAMVGDGENDIEAIAWAGLGIAMANGHPKTKETADWVSGHVDQNGFAQAINYILTYNANRS